MNKVVSDRLRNEIQMHKRLLRVKKQNINLENRQSCRKLNASVHNMDKGNVW